MEPGDQPKKRTGKLKVYSTIVAAKKDTPTGTHHSQVRMTVAATSQRAAAEAMDISLSDFRHAGGETGNAKEIAAAMSNPGQAFWRNTYGGDSDFQPWEGQEAAAEERERRAIRSAESKARVQERLDEYEADKRRRGESNQAAEMWALRLKEEFGLDCEPAKNGKVEVSVDAEKLFGRLTEIAGALRDVGLEDILIQ